MAVRFTPTPISPKETAYHERVLDDWRRNPRSASTEEHNPNGIEIRIDVEFNVEVGFGAFLSIDPLIVYTNLDHGNPFRMADACPQQIVAPVYFIVNNWWSLESPHAISWLRLAACQHRQKRPNHHLVFACNTEEEVRLVSQVGEIAILANHNMNGSEQDFYPIPDVTKKYDAVYNGRLEWWKRHDLTLSTPNCAFIFYQAQDTHEQREAVRRRHSRWAAGHEFINNEVNERPVPLEASEVNLVLNQSCVGLCLSPVEGAMYSAGEYLLSGLPVVSVQSRGGRDRYFDPEFTIVCNSDRTSVALAVAELKSKNIPRHYIRERTLQKIGADREAFFSLIDAIYEHSGHNPPVRRPWDYPHKIFTKKPWIEHWQQALFAMT